MTIGSIAIISLMALVAWLLLRPDSAEDMVFAIRNAKTPQARTEAAKRYLDTYGRKSDPKLAEKTAYVRDIYWDSRVREREGVLLNRHRLDGFRRTVERGDDAEAYHRTMDALTAEEEGDLLRARTLWKGLIDEYQPNANDDKALWGWVAAKRFKDLAQVDDLIAKMERTINHAYENEIDVKTDDDLLARALDAERLKNLGDGERARDYWERMARDLKGKPDARNWFLLAGYKSRETSSGSHLSVEERKKMLRGKLAKAEEDMNERPLNGQARQTCRAIRDLYAGDDIFKEEVQKAKKLLEKR